MGSDMLAGRLTKSTGALEGLSRIASAFATAVWFGGDNFDRERDADRLVEAVAGLVEAVVARLLVANATERVTFEASTSF